jgi:putative ABC transport system substrate-binding protein
MMPVIGLLSGLSSNTRLIGAFNQGLKESGFIEGQNVAIEYRFAVGEYGRLPALAAELIDKRVAVIATIGENAAKAAQITSRGTIPIVFALGDEASIVLAQILPVLAALGILLARSGLNCSVSFSPRRPS